MHFKIANIKVSVHSNSFLINTNCVYFHSSRMACGSNCALDNACSAFSFFGSKYDCQLGFKGGRVLANTSTPPNQVTTIYTKPGHYFTQEKFRVNKYILSQG